jgi:hypothetical protein
MEGIYTSRISYDLATAARSLGIDLPYQRHAMSYSIKKQVPSVDDYINIRLAAERYGFEASLPPKRSGMSLRII